MTIPRSLGHRSHNPCACPEEPPSTHELAKRNQQTARLVIYGVRVYTARRIYAYTRVYTAAAACVRLYTAVCLFGFAVVTFRAVAVAPARPSLPPHATPIKLPRGAQLCRQRACILVGSPKSHSEGSRARRNPRGSAPGPDLPYTGARNNSATAPLAPLTTENTRALDPPLAPLECGKQLILWA